MTPKEQVLQIYNWLEKRTDRERLYVLLGALVIIYLVWSGLISSPLSETHQGLRDNIDNTTDQIARLEQDLQETAAAAQKLNDNNVSGETSALKKQLNAQDQQIKDYLQQLADPAQAAAAMKTLLVPNGSLALTSLENTPAQLEPGLEGNSQKVYGHGIVLQFEGNYMDTLSYLQRLETLPWYFMNDELDYQVSDYPQAKITLKLHVLSFQESGLNG